VLLEEARGDVVKRKVVYRTSPTMSQEAQMASAVAEYYARRGAIVVKRNAEGWGS